MSVIPATNPRHQRFAFHNSFMNYVLKNLNLDLKETFAKTCKVFFDVYPYDWITDDILVGKSIAQFFPESFLSIHQLREYRENIWVKNVLIIDDTDLVPVPIRSFITRCTVKVLKTYITISRKEFEFLTEAGMVEMLAVDGIMQEEGLVPYEDILARVPKAFNIW